MDYLGTHLLTAQTCMLCEVSVNKGRAQAREWKLLKTWTTITTMSVAWRYKIGGSLQMIPATKCDCEM